MKYSISNNYSGLEMGVYEAANEEGALDAMAKDAGYQDHADACKVAPIWDGEFSVVEISEEVS